MITKKQRIKLIDLCGPGGIKAPPSKPFPTDKDPAKNTVPLYGPKSMYKGELVEPVGWTSREEALKNNRYLLLPGDVVVNDRGTCLRAALARGSGLCAMGLIRITPPPLVLPAYLYWAIKKEIPQLHYNATGSVFKGIKVKTVEQLVITVCPLDEQSRLTATLAVLDKLAKSKKREQKLLELLSRAICQRVF